MTPKQKKFVFEYVKDGNAYQAAIRSGYSERTAHGHAHEMLKNVEIREQIDELIEIESVGYNERLILLSEIARGFGGVPVRARLKAVELLGKLSGDYISKKQAAPTNIHVKLEEEVVTGYAIVSPEDWDSG